ncbi:helix-turn-helix domain-containing protein [Erythrobacter rubeus]|uniref:Helix-turn-helix domain-containing protein n=1 Tax=Erythrobacter rubeus TaxID=2760803 RepID=A0ABR8KPM2_9SPHN|nr:helix-turn-helix domain-containing protein [Erythrobacter rubeus]
MKGAAPATSDRAYHAERLLEMLPGGCPPPYSKLRREVWLRAASLYAANQGGITLRALCAKCGVSHRTAWRIRDALRDSERMIEERTHPTAHRSVAPPNPVNTRSLT